MFAKRSYQRLRAVEYARKWALSRNPLFQNFSGLGGDCTNFVSQCLFAGSCVMNDTQTFGWYFRAPGDYTPSWSAVQYLYDFLTENMESGPYAEEVPVTAAEVGDIVQLGSRDGEYYHSLILTGITDGVFTVCAHSNDALDRRLDSYLFERARFLHIEGVRFVVPSCDCCYSGVLSGESIFPTEAQEISLSCIPVPGKELPPEPEKPEMPEGDKKNDKEKPSGDPGFPSSNDGSGDDDPEPAETSEPGAIPYSAEYRRPADILPTEPGQDPMETTMLG